MLAETHSSRRRVAEPAPVRIGDNIEYPERESSASTRPAQARNCASVKPAESPRGVCRRTVTTRSGSRKGNCSSTAFTTVNIAVFAPTPSAIEKIAAAVVIGRFRLRRRPYAASRARICACSRGATLAKPLSVRGRAEQREDPAPVFAAGALRESRHGRHRNQPQFLRLPRGGKQLWLGVRLSRMSISVPPTTSTGHPIAPMCCTGLKSRLVGAVARVLKQA